MPLALCQGRITISLDSTLVTKNTKSREKKGNTHDFVFATRFIVYSVLLVAMTVFCQVGAEYPGLELLR
jgi:glycopeptide antibiotics resistance protein